MQDGDAGLVRVSGRWAKWLWGTLRCWASFHSAQPTALFYVGLNNAIKIMKLRNRTFDDFLTAISAQDAVFHYTRISTALEKILFDDCFKFSSLANANDPYEFKDKMIGDGGWGWEKVRDEADKTCEELDKLLKDVSFISCCANTFEQDLLKIHGFLRSRMWSQYGEGHNMVRVTKEYVWYFQREN